MPKLLEVVCKVKYVQKPVQRFAGGNSSERACPKIGEKLFG